MAGPRPSLALIAAAALVAVATLACGGPRSGEHRRVVGVPQFSHATPAHAGRGCLGCHAEADVLAGRPARPGREHAPCDASGCHAAAFTELAALAPGGLCDTCHDTVDPARPGRSPLRPFPSPVLARTLPSRFSHERHLDGAALDARVGFHVDCSDCHVAPSARQTPYGQVSHAACARCHDELADVAPRMRDCLACHDTAATAIARARQLVTPGLRFTHDAHERDFAGDAIRCRECHATATAARTPDDRITPAPESCARCHDDATRVPAPRAMRACGTCHVATFGAVRRAVAPRSHLRAELRPASHTQLFRQEHADAARSAPRQCAACHGGLSGSEGVCGECHVTMPPRDHGAAWVELLHGDEALVDGARCATCHAGDFCTTCHARPPRSHVPLAVWRGLPGDAPAHGVAARTSLRSCLTCHDVERTCAQAGCHDGVPR